jgi:hypothetical protein
MISTNVRTSYVKPELWIRMHNVFKNVNIDQNLDLTHPRVIIIKTRVLKRSPFVKIIFNITERIKGQAFLSCTTEYIFLLEINRVSVSAHSAGAYTATLLVMVNVMKGGGLAPPTPTSLG